MIILHIAPIDMTRANGLRFSVPGLVSAQNRVKGIKSGLLNINNTSKLIVEEVEKFDFDFYPIYKNIEDLAPPYNFPDIVVFHGIYHVKYINIYKKLLRKKIPYVIVPRVSLTLGAQKQKHLKKKLGNILLFNRFIDNAERIHYLTKKEMELSKAFKKEYFIVGNGINLPKKYTKNEDEISNITFIGRYDVNHKGLDILMDSLNCIKDILLERNVRINLFGSDFRGGKKFIKSKIEDYGLHKICFVNDAVYDEDKREVLKRTDIFISTSRFEGHPMAVIEAMSYGIPCILTPGTNMLDVLEDYDAGWAALLDKDSISSAILQAVEDNNGIIEKGKNARRLAEEKFDWEKVANETIRYYSDIIKG